MQVEIGSRVKDKITGFAGVVTGRCQYISGCNQALVAPPLGPDGAFRGSEWFDEQRLEQSGEAPVTLDNGANPGFDRPAPKR